MKNVKKYAVIIVLMSVAFFTGCDNQLVSYQDLTPPSPPQNVNVFNGDQRVDITWDSNSEYDIAGYNVYYAYSFNGKYNLIGSTSNTYLIDGDAVNGDTYYYAVAAYDVNGNESDLSYDVVYATPRPEGYNQSVFDYLNFPAISGYSFANYQVVDFNSDYSDFFFENFDGVFYLNVWEDTDIQDMGFTNDIYDIDEAPIDGWIPINPDDNVKYVEAIPGHSYVIWTWDNHFAKIRISRITSDRLVFDWTYQTAEGNAMLKRKSVPAERKLNGREVKK